MVVGTQQPTLATARVSGDRVQPLWTIDDDNDLGDGTVPRFASIPPKVEPGDTRQLSSAPRHGFLQQHDAILDDLQGILTARDVRYQAPPPAIDRQPGIELPEVAQAGEPLTIRAQSSDHALLIEARLTPVEGGGAGRASTFVNLGDGRYEAVMDPPPEGVYILAVRAPRDATIEPATDVIFVDDGKPTA